MLRDHTVLLTQFRLCLWEYYRASLYLLLSKHYSIKVSITWMSFSGDEMLSKHLGPWFQMASKHKCTSERMRFHSRNSQWPWSELGWDSRIKAFQWYSGTLSFTVFFMNLAIQKLGVKTIQKVWKEKKGGDSTKPARKYKASPALWQSCLHNLNTFCSYP